MIVFINGRFLTQNVTGVQRYAHEVVKHIDRIIDENRAEYMDFQFVILVPRGTSNNTKFKNIKIVSKGHFQGHLWEQIELPFFSRKGVLINLCNVAPAFKRNQIVTIHDATVFSRKFDFSFFFWRWYQIILTLESLFSKSILTVSNFSKRELIAHIPLLKKKIRVCYEGIEHIKEIKSDINIIKKNKINDKPYILAVGSMDSRKNFKNVVKAFKIIDNPNFHIVIAGGTNPKVFGDTNLFLSKNVKYLGYVTDNELKALYEHAYCFIYPSLYEGFGLPPLEAMALGCPVIVSNQSSLPEICGSAAIYCNPVNVKDIADKINYILTDQCIRKKYSELGLNRSHEFSWYKCAQNILQLIK